MISLKSVVDLAKQREGCTMSTSEQHDRFQKAITEVSVAGFCSGTITYIDKAESDEGFFAVYFPDGMYRNVLRDDMRLCW